VLHSPVMVPGENDGSVSGMSSVTIGGEVKEGSWSEAWHDSNSGRGLPGSAIPMRGP
jgi:hypothetical protein